MPRPTDGKSGWFLKRGTKLYRLRLAGKSRLDLSPSINRGALRIERLDATIEEFTRLDGCVIVFTAEMPWPPVYEVDVSFLDWLKDQGNLSAKYGGPSAAVQQKCKLNRTVARLWVPTAANLECKVEACARCGHNHRNLAFIALRKPSAEYTHWATCPDTHEPVMVSLSAGH